MRKLLFYFGYVKNKTSTYKFDFKFIQIYTCWINLSILWYNYRKRRRGSKKTSSYHCQWYRYLLNYLSFLKSAFSDRTLISFIGIGIPEDEIKGLFWMFNVSKKHRAKLNWKGTGLGLTITQKLVKMLGGEIKLESVENVGTKVFFSIPDADILW